MQLYAERPIRRISQVLSDLLALLVMVFAVWLGTNVYDEIMRLRAPGDGPEILATLAGHELARHGLLA